MTHFAVFKKWRKHDPQAVLEVVNKGMIFNLLPSDFQGRAG